MVRVMTFHLKLGWILIACLAAAVNGYCQEAPKVIPLPAVCGKPIPQTSVTTKGTDVAGTNVGKLSLDSSQLDVKLLSPGDTFSLSVINQTAAQIDKLQFSSPGLLDGKTGQRIPAFQSELVGANSLGPTQRAVCTITTPTSDHAGAYTGTLYVDGGGYEANVPLTIRMRGPFISGWSKWPLALMTIVFLLGWGISLVLDRWYTTDLPRVQQVVSLRDAQTALSGFLDRLTAWEKDQNVSLTKTDAVTAFDISELDTLLVKVNAESLSDLQQASQRFGLSCSLNDELLTALEFAKAKIPKANIPQVAQLLDAVVRGTDPSAYRAALLQVLTTPLPPAAVAPANVPAFNAGIDLSSANASTLHERIVLMDYMKLAVLGVVIWMTAYTVTYGPNPSFGTSLDYLTLFLWSLGLTTTGSQLVSGVRKP